VQGDWDVDSVVASEWATVGDHQERTITTVETRETLTAPEHGGAPCGAETQTTVTTETRPIPIIWSGAFTVDRSSDGKLRACPVGQPETACVVVD
jgi:hypothetical protein